jgi:hypothetical protein
MGKRRSPTTTCSMSTSAQMGGWTAASHLVENVAPVRSEIGVNQATSTEPASDALAQRGATREHPLGGINVSGVNPAVDLERTLKSEFDDVLTLGPNDADSSTRKAQASRRDAPRFEVRKARLAIGSVNHVTFDIVANLEANPVDTLPRNLPPGPGTTYPESTRRPT